MSGVLVVAETRRGEVRPVTLELIAAGAELKEAGAGELNVVVTAAEPAKLTPGLSALDVDKILTVTSSNDEFDSRIAASALAGVIEELDPEVVLAAHSIDSMGFLPAVAIQLNSGFAADVVSVNWDGEITARRGAYGDKLISDLRFPTGKPVLATLRAGVKAPAEVGPSGDVQDIRLDLPEPSTEHLAYVEPEETGIDITKADFLVSIGRGIEDEENLPRFEELAKRLGATLSVSRPLVDAGWAPSARQVGQSGRTVKPKVYLALGISGAVQHLAGIQGAETIVAVNTDPEAPIFGVAHYGVVADLFDVADELESQLG